MNNAEVLIKFKGDSKDLDKTTKGISGGFKGMSAAMTAANLAASAISKGIQLLAQNLDGAISRIDTMRNFPKVMKNLGISAEDSDAAINKLSDSLQGLPTTLDDAALSVQRLTSKNGDVKKSTDLFLAMNNAILAGGAPAATQTAAIEQLSQAYAKGKPDMMEWRSLMTAMPAQLKQVATAMGYVDADALGEDLRNGRVSMDEFMDTIVKLNKEGLPGLENFETQARAATGGIATAITNAKTAVTRGVASIVTAFDSALKSNGLGSLANVISTIGKAFEKLLKGKTFDLSKVKKFTQGFVNTITGLAQKIVAAIPSIIKSLEQLLPEILDMLIKGLLSIQKSIIAIIPEVIPSVVNTILDLIITLLSNVNEFINAGISMTMALIKGIVTAIPILIAKLPLIIQGIINGLIGALPQLVSMAPQIIIAIITGLISAIPMLIDMAPQIITGIITGMVKGFQNLIQTGKSIISRLWSGISSAIPNLISKIPQIPSKIISAIKNGLTNIGNVGKQMMKGLWNGMSGLKDWVINKVKGMGKSIIKGLKDALGIHSPSTEFALIGKFSVLGYTEALDKMSKDVDKQVASTFSLNPQLTGSMQNSFSPNVNVYNNVNVEQDPLGQMVSSIKTFSGGAKNDYNYGSGI